MFANKYIYNANLSGLGESYHKKAFLAAKTNPILPERPWIHEQSEGKIRY